jgi:hypothetical protein
MAVGVQSLQHEGNYYGTIRFVGLSGRQSTSGATAVFNLEIDVKPSDLGWLVINDLSGHVDVERLGDVGPCWLLNSFRVRSDPKGDKTSLFVCVMLPDATIRAIDHHRARSTAEQFSFVLWLQLRGASSTGPVDSQAVLNCPVTTSDWFAALTGSQYEARHIIDVPLQGGRVANALSVAAEHYRRAIDQWKKISYTQVFVECRKVLEATRDVLQLRPKGIAEIDARQKNAWSIDECIEYTRAAVHQIVHHAAHPGVDDDPGPQEADLLLALTGSLLRYYASVR